MTSADFEQDTPVSQYGVQRREAWLAGLRANSDNMTSAAMAAHQADHDVVTAGQRGILGALSPQELGAAVAARTARTGDAWGEGRELARNGGRYDTSTGPAPARRDLRHVDQLQPPGVSPLASYMRNRERGDG